jgi:hypothetical protein
VTETAASAIIPIAAYAIIFFDEELADCFPRRLPANKKNRLLPPYISYPVDQLTRRHRQK